MATTECAHRTRSPEPFDLPVVDIRGSSIYSRDDTLLLRDGQNATIHTIPINKNSLLSQSRGRKTLLPHNINRYR